MRECYANNMTQSRYTPNHLTDKHTNLICSTDDNNNMSFTTFQFAFCCHYTLQILY